MSNNLLIDNWLVSDVEDLLLNGPSLDSRLSLRLDQDSGVTVWQPQSSAPLQVDALLRLLIAIVTRDELLLEEKFRQTWGQEQSPLLALHQSGLVAFHHVPTGSPEVRPYRDRAIEAMCVTEALKNQQHENEQEWAAQGTVRHQAHSLAIWGGAGYLARSHVLETPYNGHPIREDVLRQTAFRRVVPDATGSVLQWIDSERKRVFQLVAKDGSGLSIGAQLPSIAVDVIENATSLHDLIPAAFQLRDEYKGFRRWMADYQAAAQSEDPAHLLKHHSILDSVDKDISRRLGTDKDGVTSISFSIVWLSLNVPMPGVNTIRRRFGMRALLNRMIFTKRGHQSLKKLVKMLGEERSSVGRDIIARYEAHT